MLALVIAKLTEKIRKKAVALCCTLVHKNVISLSLSLSICNTKH